MPLYGAKLPGVAPGDQVKLFDAEVVSAPQASIAIARIPGPTGLPGGVLFSVHFAEAPTASVQIQGANVNEDEQYQTLETITDLQDGYYADGGGFAFYRAYVASQSAGGAITVIAQR